MKSLDKTAIVILIVCAINQFLAAIFNVNIIYVLFGQRSVLTYIIFIASLLSALWCLRFLFKNKK